MGFVAGDPEGNEGGEDDHDCCECLNDQAGQARGNAAYGGGDGSGEMSGQVPDRRSRMGGTVGFTCMQNVHEGDQEKEKCGHEQADGLQMASLSSLPRSSAT